MAGIDQLSCEADAGVAKGFRIQGAENHSKRFKLTARTVIVAANACATQTDSFGTICQDVESESAWYEIARRLPA